MELNEHMLRNHAGWSMTSKMPQRYLHYFGSESSKSILRLKGIIKENEEIENKKSFIKENDLLYRYQYVIDNNYFDI